MTQWQTFALDAGELSFLPAEAGVASPLDPYLVWAEVTGFRSYLGEAALTDVGETALVTVIARLADNATLQHLRDAGPVGREPWIHIESPYDRKIPGSTQVARVFTARLARENLSWLLAATAVERFELGLPVAPPGDASNGAGEAGGADADPPSGVNPRPRHLPKRVIGIIDFGCAFLHRSFRTGDGSQSRIVNVWDQNRQPATGGLKAPPTFRYGRELSHAEINDRLRHLTALKGANAEARLYRKSAFLQDWRRDAPPSRILQRTHGTHVMDVAAGRIDPLTGVGDDAASFANLVFVSLPRSAATDSSGGSLAVHILDGLRHILENAADAATVAVNLSYGTHAGPHDGSSLLEVAMDELLASRPRRFAIVIGAGNGFRARSHAQRSVSRSQPASLKWLVQRGHVTDSFMEIWLPREVSVGGVAVETDLSVRIKPPNGTWSEWVAADRAARLVDGAAGVVACVVNQRRVPNGRDPMVLVALAPTASRGWPRPSSSKLAEPGVWELQLASTCEFAFGVDAWIERDDSPYAPDTPQSRFFGEGSATPFGTLNSFATGTNTIVVGACRKAKGALPDYTAAGPTRGGERTNPSPDLVAPAEESEALRGLRAAAVRSGDTVRMGGTSVAAPVVTRRLFNVMATSSGTLKTKDALKRLFQSKSPALDHSLDRQRIGKGRLEPSTTSAEAMAATTSNGQAPRRGKRPQRDPSTNG